MDAQDIRNLSEAYMNVYEQETGRGPRVSDTYDMRDAEGGPKGGGTIKGPKRKNVVRKEEIDLYDIILSHLLDEGYADTQEAAEAIMVNMSEDWREDIMEISDRKVDAVGRRRQANVDKAMSSDEYIFDKPGATQKLATEISKKTRFNYLNKKRERRRG
jgi:hypothetical protein